MSDSDELTRIRLENIRLQYAVGVFETENARLREKSSADPLTFPETML